jgi:hypothetical protein
MSAAKRTFQSRHRESRQLANCAINQLRIQEIPSPPQAIVPPALAPTPQKFANRAICQCLSRQD